MYNVKTKQIILEVPKCGSRSLVTAAIAQFGKKAFKYHGHKTIGQLVPMIAPTVGEKVGAIGVVRNPEERFVSQVASYMKIKSCGVAEALRACAEQSHIVFKPQYKFFEIAPDHAPFVRLVRFPMSAMHEAQEAVTGRRQRAALHINSGNAQHDIGALSRWEGYAAAIEQFAPDWHMWEMLNNE